MKEKILPALLICFFIRQSYGSFQESKAMHENGVVITPKVTRYMPGEMGSVCPIGIVVVQGRKAEVHVGGCSTNPPPIGSEFEILYNPATQKVAEYSPGTPYYTWSFIYAGLAFLFLCMAWPNNSFKGTPNGAP